MRSQPSRRFVTKKSDLNRKRKKKRKKRIALGLAEVPRKKRFVLRIDCSKWGSCLNKRLRLLLYTVVVIFHI